MRIGSLFSGIGGLELGLEHAGLGHTVWQVEQNAFGREVLAQRWPTARRFEDVKNVGAHNLAPVDLICGGFPCQDISGAGKGAGLAGSRSGLWREFARVVAELGPEWVVVENVASGASRWVDAVVRELGELGYETLPLPISAADVGAPHRRARVFLVSRRVSNAVGEPLRNGTERQPARRAPGVRDEGQSQPGDVGEHLANTNCEHAQGAGAAEKGSRRQGTLTGGRHPTNARQAGGLADARGGRRQGGRLAQHGDEQGQTGADSDGCCGDGGLGWPPGPLEGWDDWFRAGCPRQELNVPFVECLMGFPTRWTAVCDERRLPLWETLSSQPVRKSQVK